MNFSDKSTVLISDKLALTYFGTTDAVGKPLSQVVSGETREFTIGGVYKAFPFNSSFRFDLISRFDNYFVDPKENESIGWFHHNAGHVTFLSVLAVSRLRVP